MAPAGLAGASFVLSAYELGWIASGDERTVGVLIAVFAVPLQGGGAILSLLRGEAAAGASPPCWPSPGWRSASRSATRRGNDLARLGFLLVASAALVLLSTAGAHLGWELTPVFAATAVRLRGRRWLRALARRAWQKASGSSASRRRRRSPRSGGRSGLGRVTALSSGRDRPLGPRRRRGVPARALGAGGLGLRAALRLVGEESRDHRDRPRGRHLAPAVAGRRRAGDGRRTSSPRDRAQR